MVADIKSSVFESLAVVARRSSRALSAADRAASEGGGGGGRAMLFCFSGAMLVGCRMPPSADDVQCTVVWMFLIDTSCGASLVSLGLPRAAFVVGGDPVVGFFEEVEDTRRCFIDPSIPPILVPFPGCCIGAPEGRRGVKAFIVWEEHEKSVGSATR